MNERDPNNFADAALHKQNIEDLFEILRRQPGAFMGRGYVVRYEGHVNRFAPATDLFFMPLTDVPFDSWDNAKKASEVMNDAMDRMLSEQDLFEEFNR